VAVTFIRGGKNGIQNIEMANLFCRAFNIFQVYQYFTIYRPNYRWYLLLKFEQLLWISYTTLFKIKRYQRPFSQVKVSWYHLLLKGLVLALLNQIVHLFTYLLYNALLSIIPAPRSG
jgi:hypothetical protein